MTERVAGPDACSRGAPRFQVYAPEVAGDTLTGRAEKKAITVEPMIALSDICGLEKRKTDVAATVAASMVLLVVAAAGIFLATCDPQPSQPFSICG